MTLNTFHFAGVGAKNVTLGVPRLKELINVAKVVKTPSLAVYLSGDLGQNQERAKDVQSMLEHTTLEKVTSFTQIFWDPDPEHTLVEEDQEWVSLYYELPDEDENPQRCGPWLLRIQLSNKVMTDKKLTVREVGERILSDFQNDLDCIFTDDNAEELVLRIRLLKEPDQIGVAPRRFDPRDDTEDKNFKFLRTIEANILKEMTLKGIQGIKKVFMREDKVTKYDEGTGKFERSQEWVLDTDGVNMEEVMLLEEVDFKRLQSNDIVEILNVLGIEATRKALLFHVRMVISFDGSYVNYRHLGTMCDVMTNRGHLMAITRHGVNRTNMGPLMKCSFEETVEILMDAAVYHETDHMRSVSENIIFGQLVPIGTGSFDVHMDDMKTVDPETSLQPLCSLDHATVVLPSKSKSGEYYSVNTPEPHMEDDDLEENVETPHEDEAMINELFPTTGGTYAHMATPEVSPDSPGDLGEGAFRSPFSVAPAGGPSPFSVRATPRATPYGGRWIAYSSFLNSNVLCVTMRYMTPLCFGSALFDLGRAAPSLVNASHSWSDWTQWQALWQPKCDPRYCSIWKLGSESVVPSDITIVEEKKTIGKRKLMPWERTGLLGMAPMLHLHYSKLDKGDKRKILSRKFDPDDASEANQICIRRQESVRKEVVATNFMWDTALTMAGLTWWSFRRYNYQSRLVALPFIFYGGTFVGRVIGDVVTGLVVSV
ncbi:polr2a [Symbiodinium necroappetens]|uniref:DNA-directed RNA polymerase n=1 Tax=Symbiodinium necroappetens TaxID=1628268 RepID=A0A812XVU8_9DINO|nr:polr2a [Symbiodinium necroappetens]